jgi:hypothetical protein
MILERGKASAFFGGQINDAMTRLKTAIDEGASEGEINSIITEIHTNSRDLMAINPSLGYIQLNKVKGLMGGTRDFDVTFGDLMQTEAGSFQSIAKDMVNEGWNPDDPNDPILQRVREIPGIVDPLTGAVNEDLVGVVKTLAVQYMLGADPDLDALQKASLETKLFDGLTPEAQRELEHTQARLNALAPNAPVNERLKLMQRVRVLTMRNWMLSQPGPMSAEPIRTQSDSTNVINKLPGGGQ